METSKTKKGQQRRSANKKVKELDEMTVTGENLFGEPMESFEYNKHFYKVALKKNKYGKQ